MRFRFATFFRRWDILIVNGSSMDPMLLPMYEYYSPAICSLSKCGIECGQLLSRWAVWQRRKANNSGEYAKHWKYLRSKLLLIYCCSQSLLLCRTLLEVFLQASNIGWAPCLGWSSRVSSHGSFIFYLVSWCTTWDLDPSSRHIFFFSRLREATFRARYIDIGVPLKPLASTALKKPSRRGPSILFMWGPSCPLKGSIDLQTETNRLIRWASLIWLGLTQCACDWRTYVHIKNQWC